MKKLYLISEPLDNCYHGEEVLTDHRVALFKSHSIIDTISFQQDEQESIEEEPTYEQIALEMGISIEDENLVNDFYFDKNDWKIDPSSSYPSFDFDS